MIFIVGNSRSGTTMMSRIIGNNKDVHALQEIHFFEWMVTTKDLKKTLKKDEAIKLLNKLIGIQKESFYSQNNLSIYTTESEKILSSINNSSYTALDIYYSFLIHMTNTNNKIIPCEQTPKNLYYIPEILNNFDNAKIIHMVRDPRSILLSQKNKWKRRFLGEKEMPIYESLRAWTLYHPITIAKLWKSAINTGKAYTSDRFLTVKFEEFLNAPEKHLQDICKFCHISFDPEMLNVPQIGSSIGNDNPNKQGIDKNKSVTWKSKAISDTELYLMQYIAKKQMKELGYSLEEIRPNYLYLSYLYITFPIKIGISILLNLGRMKNIFETLKRRMK